MIRRITAGLAALAALALALIGLPLLLTGVAHALADVMPAWSEVPGALLAPGDGGLFLLMVLVVGWLCWATFLIAFLAEAAARARGVSAPRLGRFFPQATAAQMVTAIVVMATTLTPRPAAATPATATAPAAVSTPQNTVMPAVARPAARDERGSDRYTVRAGDTLWEISEDRLGDPNRYPEIANASRRITQPGGEHLADPDLIRPGWELAIPDPGNNHPNAGGAVNSAGREQDNTRAHPTTPGSAALASEPTATAPDTPMTPTGSGDSEPTTPGHLEAAGDTTGPTPMRPRPSHGIAGLPDWITTPLIPTARD